MLFLIVYLTGSIASYLMQRAAWKKQGFKWTVGDRNDMLVISLTSWLGFLFGLIIYLITIISDKNYDKPAKW